MPLFLAHTDTPLPRPTHGTPHTPAQPTPPAHALLTAGDPIKNAQAILRYALPINNKPIRYVQVCVGVLALCFEAGVCACVLTAGAACARVSPQCRAANTQRLKLRTPASAPVAPVCPHTTQRELELIAEALRIPGSKSLGPVAKVGGWGLLWALCCVRPLFGAVLVS
jgi:hypothetical protein